MSKILEGPCALMVLVALAFLWGCESHGGFSPPEPFPASTPSLGVLGESVLESLLRGDTSALEAVRLTEEEHNQVVWPELPASQPEVNFPVEMAWQNIQTRNRRDLGRLLPLFQGRKFRYRDTECRGETREFQTFSVLTDCWIVFEDETGRFLESQVFKDACVRYGGHKVFRYYGEGVRAYQGREE